MPLLGMLMDETTFLLLECLDRTPAVFRRQALIVHNSYFDVLINWLLRTAFSDWPFR